MTAIVVAARAAGCLVLLLAMVTAVFWTAVPQHGAWTVLWLAAMFVTITGAGTLLAGLWPKGDGDG